MKNIADVDKNLAIKTNIQEKNIAFFDVTEEPFALYGIQKDDAAGLFARMPLEIAKTVNDGVYSLCTNTSGGRVRFRTDSPYLAVRVAYPIISSCSNMSVSGTTGLDLFVHENGEYRLEWVFIPGLDENTGFEAIRYFPERKMREFTLNLPLYNNVNAVHIGIEKDAVLESGDRYIDKKPIVFYGSSITQGGCASRPGNAYPAILSREYNVDFLNLGFSGSAFGEPKMAEYIAELDMSCFVMDYDHNAADSEHLQNTHYNMYEIVRKKHPQLPIILMTMPYGFYNFDGRAQERRDIIQNTYKKARSQGDDHIYFVDINPAFEMFGGEIGTTDLLHPNDLGFACMAKALKPVFDSIFKE